MYYTKAQIRQRMEQLQDRINASGNSSGYMESSKAKAKKGLKYWEYLLRRCGDGEGCNFPNKVIADAHKETGY